MTGVCIGQQEELAWTSHSRPVSCWRNNQCPLVTDHKRAVQTLKRLRGQLQFRLCRRRCACLCTQTQPFTTQMPILTKKDQTMNSWRKPTRRQTKGHPCAVGRRTGEPISRNLLAKCHDVFDPFSSRKESSEVWRTKQVTSSSKEIQDGSSANMNLEQKEWWQ